MPPDDGCGALLPFRNSQKALDVLMSGLVEPHKGIHHVAFRGTALHGRRQTSGVRHGRLVDAPGRFCAGWISGFDGLMVRSRSSSGFALTGDRNRSNFIAWSHFPENAPD